MRILVTSGGTREYIDDIRVMTNISTGKLGSKITEQFIKNGHDVIFIHSATSVVPNRLLFTEKLLARQVGEGTITDIVANSAQEVFTVMEEYVPQVDIVVNAMAISDFGFNRKNPVKLKSDDPEAFIEYMRANIRINPKIIAHVKEWNPDVILVGFKFEVGKSTRELVAIARQFLEANNADIVIANDKVEMKKYKEHIAYLVTKDQCAKMVGKDEIAARLIQYLTGEREGYINE